MIRYQVPIVPWLRGVVANFILVGLIAIALGADWAVGWR